jgi:hypothetical protein
MRMIMKRSLLVLLFIPALSLGVNFKGRIPEEQPELFGQGTVVQIGVVVKDIEKASAAYADLLGVALPKWSWTDMEDKAHTQFKGKPSPARAKLGLILELLENF